MHLNIHLLGSLQVYLDTKLLTRFGFENVRALLVYLAVEKDANHERSSLAYLLWPDASAKIGLQNLRQTLASLRRVLQDKRQEVPFLLTTSSTIRINPQSNYSLDLITFSRLIEETEYHRHRRLDICASCMRKLETAVDLYRNDFASGLYVSSNVFEEWLRQKREQLHVQVMRALTSLTDYYLRHSRLREATNLARRQVALYPLCDIGHHQLIQSLAADGRRHAALEHCMEYKKLLQQELMLSLPSKTESLYRELASENWERTNAQFLSPCNLPKPVTPFVGYEQEVAVVRERLASLDGRFVALVGIVGSGKSRIAIEVGWAELPNFPDGVYYAQLIDVPAHHFLSAIAKTVLPEVTADTPIVSQLTTWLRDKEILLILDHFDHLIESYSATLYSLLREVPGLHVIVTSQERVKLRGETFIVIKGLDYTLDTEAKAFNTFGAVRFFAQSARRWHPDFTPAATSDEREAVAQICHATNGNPRALELFAHAMTLYSLSELVEKFDEISEWGALLGNGGPKRQQSMRDMFEYAWQRLSPSEQQVLVALSVFNESFSLLAGQEVTGAHPTMLLSLHAKSWLHLRCRLQTRPQRKPQQHVPSACYRIPNLFRRYTFQLLQQENNASLFETLQQTHATYYMNYLRQRVIRLEKGSANTGLIEAIRNEMDNINQAWDWVLAHQKEDMKVQIEHDLTFFYITLNRSEQENQKVPAAEMQAKTQELLSQ